MATLLTMAGFDASADPPHHGNKITKPLTIKEQGSFFMGGEVLNRGTDDDVTIHQMYVQFQVPMGRTGVPIVLTHGCCLSSKTWETTPDGRMGWDEYFVRRGHPVYLTDQSGRARSGFNATVYNQVTNGELPAESQPLITHVSHQRAWDIFRFGPSFGVPYADQQFPIEALDTFWKQMIPDLNRTLPADNPTWDNLAALADQVGGAVLVGHSQSGHFPLQAALINPEGTRGLIDIEGFCPEYTEDEIEVLAGIPILVVYGDHLDFDIGGFNWQDLFDECNVFIDRINAAGGNATMMFPPALGIFGNSHMLMQDRNSLQLADMILEWIRRNVH